MPRSTMKLSLFIVGVFAALASTEPVADDNDPFIPPIYQLSSYNLNVVVSSDTLSGFDTANNISGEVEIIFAVNETTSQVKLHCAHDFITLQKIVLNGAPVADYSINNATDVLTVPSSKGKGMFYRLRKVLV